MTKEQLLKIYSAYLPYKVNLMNKYGNWHNTTMHKSISIYDGIENYKLVLYSMDMLTKEITHNGETFVPIEIFEIGDDSGSYPIEYNHGNIGLIKDLESIAKHSSYHDIQFLPFEIVQRLISWHFNVFNLPDTDYIKKESL